MSLSDNLIRFLRLNLIKNGEIIKCMQLHSLSNCLERWDYATPPSKQALSSQGTVQEAGIILRLANIQSKRPLSTRHSLSGDISED